MYTVKLSFKSEGEIMSLRNRELVTRRSALQKMFKELLQKK